MFVKPLTARNVVDGPIAGTFGTSVYGLVAAEWVHENAMYAASVAVGSLPRSVE